MTINVKRVKHNKLEVRVDGGIILGDLVINLPKSSHASVENCTIVSVSNLPKTFWGRVQLISNIVKWGIKGAK